MKSTDEMDFNEFVNWATGYIVFGIGEGTRLRELVWCVCNRAMLNEVFGGRKPAPAKPSKQKQKGKS